MRALGDILMKGIVGVVVIYLFRDAGLHRSTSPLQFFLFFFPDAFRRKRSNPGFNLQAYLIKLLCQLHLIGNIVKAKGIRHLTDFFGYIGPFSPSDFQTVPGDQDFNGFPYCAAADIKAFRQLKFIGQLIPDTDISFFDQITDLLSNPFRQGKLFVLLHNLIN